MLEGILWASGIASLIGGTWKYGRRVWYVKRNREKVADMTFYASTGKAVTLERRNPWKEAIKLAWQDKHIWQR